MVSLFPHPVSFRFRLTTDTLAFGYLLPATGRIRVFHPLESCAAGRTQTGVVSLKRGNSFLVQKSIRTMKIRMPAVECNYHENKHAADRLYSNDEWIWYRQVLCANSFTSLAELSLHRAGKPALNYLVAEDRERVKGGEAACEALDVNSVFCYQPASSSCISMCFMLMYFFPPHWVPAT